MKSKKKLLIVRIILSFLLIMTLVLKRAHFISDNVNSIIIILIALAIIFGQSKFIKK
ncbi:hypothetical protein Clo1100_2973 [Clostridium sp. BNL1100]|nr:hypothetical protein Clo1100_2973 [Clostridium sp. BNL1100]